MFVKLQTFISPEELLIFDSLVVSKWYSQIMSNYHDHRNSCTKAMKAVSLQYRKGIANDGSTVVTAEAIETVVSKAKQAVAAIAAVASLMQAKAKGALVRAKEEEMTAEGAVTVAAVAVEMVMHTPAEVGALDRVTAARVAAHIAIAATYAAAKAAFKAGKAQEAALAAERALRQMAEALSHRLAASRATFLLSSEGAETAANEAAAVADKAVSVMFTALLCSLHVSGCREKPLHIW